MKISCLISAGELMDKISILEIKKNSIKDLKKIKNVILELHILKEKAQQFPKYRSWVNKIKIINFKIWKCVAKIWIYENEKNYNKAFIKLARDIYILNDKRYRIKEKINRHYNSYIIEEKSY